MNTIHPESIQGAREQLDAHLREIITWHFSPDTACPFWLDWARKNFDPRKEITRAEDLAKFPHFQDEWLRDLQPDVVLMDLSMPELNGADATRAILQRDPRCRVIVLSMYSDREYVRRALKAGAAGYVVKRSAAKEVVEAIRAVHAGQRYLSPRVADVVINDYAEERDDPLARLSAREREVLQLLAEGRTGAEIAQRLSLSQKTVETYRARLVEKLGIRDVAGLVRFAIQRGLVSLE